jgi:hypothetical protein
VNPWAAVWVISPALSELSVTGSPFWFVHFRRIGPRVTPKSQANTARVTVCENEPVGIGLAAHHVGRWRDEDGENRTFLGIDDAHSETGIFHVDIANKLQSINPLTAFGPLAVEMPTAADCISLRFWQDND